jgi:hypothetical protein
MPKLGIIVHDLAHQLKAGAFLVFRETALRARPPPACPAWGGVRLGVPAGPAIHPRAVGTLQRVTICRELRHSDQLIKLEHGGTDRRQKTNGQASGANPYRLAFMKLLDHLLADDPILLNGFRLSDMVRQIIL